MNPKPFNGGQWTAARFNQFIRTALRRAQWPPKFKAIEAAYVRDGINSKTGRKCKLHRCENCLDLFPKGDIEADHVEPVIGPEGFVDWNTFIARLFCEQEGFRAVCGECHRIITAMARFNTDEIGVYRLDAIRSFEALTVMQQVKMLQELNLSIGQNKTENLQIYTKHLDELAK